MPKVKPPLGLIVLDPERSRVLINDVENNMMYACHDGKFIDRYRHDLKDMQDNGCKVMFDLIIKRSGELMAMNVALKEENDSDDGSSLPGVQITYSAGSGVSSSELLSSSAEINASSDKISFLKYELETGKHNAKMISNTKEEPIVVKPFSIIDDLADSALMCNVSKKREFDSDKNVQMKNVEKCSRGIPDALPKIDQSVKNMSIAEKFKVQVKEKLASEEKKHEEIKESESYFDDWDDIIQSSSPDKSPIVSCNSLKGFSNSLKSECVPVTTMKKNWNPSSQRNTPKSAKRFNDSTPRNFKIEIHNHLKSNTSVHDDGCHSSLSNEKSAAFGHMRSSIPIKSFANESNAPPVTTTFSHSLHRFVEKHQKNLPSNSTTNIESPPQSPTLFRAEERFACSETSFDECEAVPSLEHFYCNTYPYESLGICPLRSRRVKDPELVYTVRGVFERPADNTICGRVIITTRGPKAQDRSSIGVEFDDPRFTISKVSKLEVSGYCLIGYSNAEKNPKFYAWNDILGLVTCDSSVYENRLRTDNREYMDKKWYHKRFLKTLSMNAFLTGKNWSSAQDDLWKVELAGAEVEGKRGIMSGVFIADKLRYVDQWNDIYTFSNGIIEVTCICEAIYFDDNVILDKSAKYQAMVVGSYARTNELSPKWKALIVVPSHVANSTNFLYAEQFARYPTWKSPASSVFHDSNSC